MTSRQKSETSHQADRPGRLVLARHGRPALDRSTRVSARGYYDWWQAYEAGGLDPASKPPQALLDIAANSQQIVSSTRLRAIETALALTTKDQFTRHEVFVEAALPSPPFPYVRLLPSTWDVWSRFLWWLGMKRGQESREQAEQRVFCAVSKLEEIAADGSNVLLCSHGWFNRMMRPVLQGRGWDCIYDGRDNYWSFRVYEKRF